MPSTSFSLVSYRWKQEVRVGLVTRDRVWDINKALEKADPVPTSDPGGAGPVQTMLELLNAWDRWLPRLRKAAAGLQGASSGGLA